MKMPRQRYRAWLYKGLVVLFVVSTADYAVAPADEGHIDGRQAIVISEYQKAAFLAYVRRRNIQPSLFTDPVSVGDRLPDFGITYYVLPLGYGHPFYRYASVGPQIVIVERVSGAVVQVLD